MAIQSQLSVADFINYYQSYLDKHGIASPRNDVEILMTHSFKISRNDLMIAIAKGCLLKDVVDLESDELLDVFKLNINKRAQRIPLQHITNEAYFYGLELIVGEGVFIPRPETEVLVETVIDYIKKEYMNSSNMHILDLCSGSGAISIALATNVKNAHITAVENDKTAYNYLLKNINKYQKNFKSDIVTFFADATKFTTNQKYDIICSNPPYIPLNKSSSLEPEVQKDPHRALFGDEIDAQRCGSNGFEIPSKIIQNAVHLLNNDSKNICHSALIVERYETQECDAVELFKRCGLHNIINISDLNGLSRFTFGTL